MIPATFAYARADSVDEAIALLAEHGDDAKLLAGGHSLLPLMKLRLATPSVLVDVGHLARPLVHPRRAATTIAIGGAHPPPRRRARPTCCAEHVPLLRARGRRGRRPAGAPPRHARRLARARRPRVRPARGRARARRHASWRAGPAASATIAADDFFHGFLETALAPDEVITEVRVPKIDGAGWAFEKFNRRAQDWAIVGVAAVGGDAPRRRAGQHGLHAGPRHRGRGRAAERRVGRPTPPTLAADGTDPPSDLNASPEYRRHLARVLVGRALDTVRRRRRPMTATTFGAGSLVGAPVRRVEDPTLLAGRGHLHRQPRRRRRARTSRSCARRSRTPSSVSIDTSDARAMPGVVAVYTAADLDVPDYAGMMQLHPDGRPPRARAGPGALRRRHRRGRRRRDARRRRSTPPRRSIVDYDPLPAVTDMEAALAPDAPLQFERVGSNVVMGGSASRRRRPARRAPTWSCAAASRTSGVAVVPMEGARDRGRPGRRRRRPRAHRVPRVPDAAHEPRRARAGMFGLEPDTRAA